ncbi:MAG TPA: GIY-YIG nuclease family protein [Candidatus Paceibacterota bacterium]
MFTVYILRDSTGKLYKGMTGDLVRRLREHISGQTRTTRKMQNLKVVYTEVFQTLEEARKRERYFKSAGGRRYLKTKLIGV